MDDGPSLIGGAVPGDAARVSRPFTLQHLAIRELRNLERVDLEPARRINVIYGNNGHGKTSVLEAIYLLATSRSFRTSRLAEVLRHDVAVGSSRGTFAEHWPDNTITREQSVGVEGSRRRVKLNGQAPRSLTDYATRSPVVVFDPQQMTLSTGPSSERRTLLDRVTLFTHPEVATHRSRYQQALRDRQRLLADSWPRFDRPELDAYEVLLAEHGAALTRARRAACATLTGELGRAWHEIASPELELTAAYDPRGSDDVATGVAQLADDRRKDGQRKTTSFGPHRDDLTLALDGHPARVVGSQGQHRAITLALKSAELVCIAEARQLEPILLLDDVSSELDAERTAALFAFLAATESQIFLTTTRRDLIVTPAKRGEERCDFEVKNGVVVPVRSPS